MSYGVAAALILTGWMTITLTGVMAAARWHFELWVPHSVILVVQYLQPGT